MDGELARMATASSFAGDLRVLMRQCYMVV